MKRFIGLKRTVWFFLGLVALVACARHEPTPTSRPLPGFVVRPTAGVLSTPTPAGSPVPRITIVPSATRRATTQLAESTEPGPLPTVTFEATLTLVPMPTPTPTLTPRIVDAGPTPTQPVEPTPTPADTPVPTPTQVRSPLEPPPGSTPTPSPSAAPPSSDSLEVESVFSYYDGENEIFFVAGEVVNYSDSHQRVTRLMPVVLDDSGMALSSDDNVFSPENFDTLRESISLAPGRAFPFGFEVELPEGVLVEDNFEIQVETEPAESGRDDFDYFDEMEDQWPDFLFVTGTYVNPGAELTQFVAIVVAVYDIEERVVAVGLQYETDPDFLSSAEHEFDVEINPWTIVQDLEIEMDWYDVRMFGE